MSRAGDFFGDEAGELWSSTMAAMHRFAHMTGCPLGTDVVQWFSKQHDALVRDQTPKDQTNDL